MSIGSVLVLLVALGVVALDVAVASPWTGLIIVFGMAAVTLAVAEEVRQMIFARRKAAGMDGVLWFEVSLLLALLGFLLARTLALTGSETFKQDAVRIMAERGMDVVLDDPVLEQQRQAAVTVIREQRQAAARPQPVAERAIPERELSRPDREMGR